MTSKAANAIGADTAEQKKWMAESDLRTLIDAEKIKADPDRIKAAMKCRDEMKKALVSIST
jgi:hypothetical protein